MSKQRNWTRSELILAATLYCQLPFGKMHQRNPEVRELAELIGRTPGAVAYKLVNFASIDPTLDREGASHVSRLDREVWTEFFDNWGAMFIEATLIRSRLEGNWSVRHMAVAEDLQTDAVETVCGRRYQDFFRRMVLSGYGGKCCITGLRIERLLIASHIVPWAIDRRNRLNPRNGLCLNALHDRAFDAGLMTLDDDWRVVISRNISDHPVGDAEHALLLRYEGHQMSLPTRFRPDPAFLSYHRSCVFAG